MLVSIIREALSSVTKNADVRQGVREMAKRGLLQWDGSARPPAQVPGGTYVNFDSDDE